MFSSSPPPSYRIDSFCSSYSCASSKHLQTRRYLDTLEKYLLDVSRVIQQIYRQANERPDPFVDHTGTLRDSRTGNPISAHVVDETGEDEEEEDELSEFHYDVSAVVLLTLYSWILVL